nr:uncharacterized protein CI109_002485 [Kwoniella shandongensis]KAA5529144.1 hypothetical protein CI109_002485 [Kwoniella shandongensis]
MSRLRRRLSLFNLLTLTAFLISPVLSTPANSPPPQNKERLVIRSGGQLSRSVPPADYALDANNGVSDTTPSKTPTTVVSVQGGSEPTTTEVVVSSIDNVSSTAHNVTNSTLSLATSLLTNLTISNSTSTTSNLTNCISASGDCTIYLSALSNCTTDQCACSLTFQAQLCAMCVSSHEEDESKMEEVVKRYNDLLTECRAEGWLSDPEATISANKSETGTESSTPTQTGHSSQIGAIGTASMTTTSHIGGTTPSDASYTQSPIRTSEVGQTASSSLSASPSASSGGNAESGTSRDASSSTHSTSTPSSQPQDSSSTSDPSLSSSTSPISPSSPSSGTAPDATNHDTSPASAGTPPTSVNYPATYPGFVAAAMVTSSSSAPSDGITIITSTQHLYPASSPSASAYAGVVAEQQSSSSDESDSSSDTEADSDDPDITVFTSYSTILPTVTPSNSASASAGLLNASASAATTLALSGMLATDSDALQPNTNTTVDTQDHASITTSSTGAVNASLMFFSYEISSDCTSDCQVWKQLSQQCTADSCMCTSSGLTSSSSCSDCIGREEHGDDYPNQMSAYAAFEANCSLSDSSFLSTESVAADGSSGAGAGGSGGLGLTAPSPSVTRSTNPFGQYGESSSTSTITATVEAAQGVITSSVA